MHVETKFGPVFVKFRHFRYWDGELFPNGYLKKCREEGRYPETTFGFADILSFDKEYFSSQIEPTGGLTVCVLEKDGVKIEASANCSMKDPFNRKKGREISFGRALKLLEKQCVQAD